MCVIHTARQNETELHDTNNLALAAKEQALQFLLEATTFIHHKVIASLLTYTILQINTSGTKRSLHFEDLNTINFYNFHQIPH